MSGGHFDYQQYTLRDIADTIERDIARAMTPKPPKKHEDYWTIYEMTRPFAYHSLYMIFRSLIHTTRRLSISMRWKMSLRPQKNMGVGNF
jgi:hypothetical protein